MTNNYVGPGWYWVEGAEGPVYLRYYPVYGGPDMKLVQILAHIPRPAQRPVVDWSVMPAWAKWVAMDNGGIWCWYTDEPSINDRHYVVDNGIYGTIPREHAPTYTGDWKNSLVGRPE